jgi:hypothetical protein
VLTPEAYLHVPSPYRNPNERDQPAVLGAIRMLQELRQQFDIVDGAADFAGYRLVILPDQVPVDTALAAKLKAYLKAGGAVLASFASGLAPTTGACALAELGIKVVGEAPYNPDFLVPGELLDEGLRPTGHVMYRRGLQVEPVGEARVLAQAEAPYFNRTWRHFCSHRHTPTSGRLAYPAVVQNGRCLYFAHPIFSQYQDNAPRWCKQLLANALAMLMPSPVVEVDGPSSLLVTLSEQAAQQRCVLHLLHYIPERRGQAFDVIEDVIPLFDLPVSVRLASAPKSVRLVPDGGDLAFDYAGGRVTFTVPRLDGHAMVELAV